MTTTAPAVSTEAPVATTLPFFSFWPNSIPVENSNRWKPPPPAPQPQLGGGWLLPPQQQSPQQPQHQFLPFPFLFFPSLLRASTGLFQPQPAAGQAAGLTPASTVRQGFPLFMVPVPPAPSSTAAMSQPWGAFPHRRHAFRPPVHPVNNFFYLP